jgi:FkbM family methyltransferase
MSPAEPPDWSALLRGGRARDLAEAVAAALEAGDIPPTAAVEAAMAERIDRDDPAAALRLWQRMATRAPGFLPAAEPVAALDAAGHGAAVLALLRQAAVPAGPAGQALRLQRAQLLARFGDPDAARAGLEEGLAIAPASVPFALARLRRAIADNDPPAIRAAADRVLSLPGAAPAWLWRFLGLFEAGRIEIGPVALDLPADLVPPSLMLAFAAGRYEAAEAGALAADLRPDDRLLDLGAGSGYAAIRAGLACPGLPILAVEANPALIPVITANFARNGVAAEVLSGAVGARDGTVDLALTAHFPGASVLHAEAGLERLSRPQIGVAGLQARFRPSVVSIDIEGAEAAVIPALDLAPLRRLVVEFHPGLTGAAVMSDLLRRILDAGLVHDRAPEGHVHAFGRPGP